MTALDHLYIEAALGPEVASIAMELEHAPTRHGWGRLLRALQQHPDVMESEIGKRMAGALRSRSEEPDVYEGVWLDTSDPEKLIPLVDQLLFYVRAARLRTRPLAIREGEGVAEIVWSKYAPRAFSGRVLLCVARGEQVDVFTLLSASSYLLEAPFQGAFS